MNKPTIRIDIVSDIVCPWCYIGKRRLERALDKLSDKFDFVLEYHPFELNPAMPIEGVKQQEYLIKKFGSTERYHQLTRQVTQVAAQEDISFHYDKQQVSPNTRNAHRLVQLANQEGKQVEMVEALFKAYFTDGIDLSKRENMLAVAVQVGLDREKTSKLLASEEGLLQIALAEQELQKLGITGVPFYIVNNTYGISGAQPLDAFVQVFEQIGSEVAVSAEGDACDIDGNNC
ncbi:DsbA family oxidoreductase [Rhodocytophaga rosea]|uniref:DsbA family oxidoreductase n=1 Tax=Rhodocytophaga rosea TaxID=2704465 RepID=A0A6C0GGF7_9BACT|nr:DsbA family oxidoreductase [Rhodocytophaga rosea]QHT67096.1 DsbA family oxidoreductase [Rhodocytophaga rosea]